MKIKYKEVIYDVLDTYDQGFIIEKPERGYKYVGKLARDCEVIDGSPIEYIKTKKFLNQIRFSYSHTKFVNEEYVNGEIDVEENTITVYNNVVVFYSPSMHDLMILGIKPSKRTGCVWGFEKHSDNTISLSPSIRSTQNEHQEHYFIKRNKVVSWQSDSWATVYIKK